jgi:hypothetical protein
MLDYGYGNSTNFWCCYWLYRHNAGWLILAYRLAEQAR